MSTQDLLSKLSTRPGTSQSDRDDPRLSPEHAPLDDRDTAALLIWARALAKLVRYQRDPESPEIDWSSFFPAGGHAELKALVARTDGGVSPHLALWIAAFELGGSGAQRLLNGFTARHLQYQTQDVLGFVPRQPQPDRAYLVLELKKGAGAVEIGPAHRFGAGKDAHGVEQIYAPVRPVVLNAAKVERLCSLHRDGDRLRFAPIADSADGLGEEFAGDARRWAPFARKGMPSAPVGFAVASPVLKLAEGVREIRIVLEVSGLRERHDVSALAASFQAHATGPKGWSGPFDVSTSLQGEMLEFAFTVGAAQVAVVDHDPAVHLQAFPAGMPVVQLLLKKDAPLAFGAFDGVTVRSAQVLVRVSGLRELTLDGDGGTLDARKAFLPFGPQPVAGSRLIIGCPEALSKRLTSLSLHLSWQGAPANLASWYAGYARQSQMSDGVGATLTWVDASGSTRTTPPLDLMQRLDGVTTLRPPVGATARAASVAEQTHALLDSGGFAARRVARAEALVSPTKLSAPRAGTTAPRAGSVTLTLVEDFLHADHRRESLAKLMQDPASALNEPYTPKVRDIELDYAAQSDVSRLDAVEQSAFTDTELRYFHVDALGCSREHAWLARQRPWAPQRAPSFLPEHVDAGELLIGLSGLAKGDSVSVLLQVAQGSADPEARPQPIRWSVMADNAWRALTTTGIALDTTRGLRTSGLISVALPRETSTEHTRLPAGLVWLRATIPAEPLAACDLVGVYANAIEATFVDQGNDPGRLARPLPPGSIAKIKTAVPALKSVLQPHASFDGAMRESDRALARRASERLRHRGRAITAWDVERLVLENFPSVYRANCVPHADGTSWLAAGHAMLVVVPDLRNLNSVDRLEPRVDLDTLEQIHALLRERGGMGVVWHVVNPQYRSVRLDFKLRLRPGFGFNHSRAVLNEALVGLLSPWAVDSAAELDFGGRVVRSALLDFVESQPYVEFVTDFRLFVEGDARDTSEGAADTPATILVSVPEHGIAEEIDG